MWVLHGSATSLSSGGSGRSWADCVRGATAQEDRPAGLHCSAEDLGSGVPGRQVADAEGWCTGTSAAESFLFGFPPFTARAACERSWLVRVWPLPWTELP